MTPLKFLMFLYLVLIAGFRGLSRRWPKVPDTPSGYGGVHCGLKFWECWDMYKKHGWKPWCFQHAGKYGTAKMFVVYDDDGCTD